jgi:hypothetical protein
MSMLHSLECSRWDEQFSAEIKSQLVNLIENGAIIQLPSLAFSLTPDEIHLLSLDLTNQKAKNISYNPLTGALGGVKSIDHQAQLTTMLQRYAMQAAQLIKALFPEYADHLTIGRTSFRPTEISGRVTSYRKDDTRLHVDAFPATPNQGRRILRIFTNINPQGKSRVWRVGDSFPHVVKHFLPQVRKPLAGKSTLMKLLRLTKSYRTEYDHIMLKIHDLMKADLRYQAAAPQREIQFSPGSSWIVQTDQVSHAAMSGQHVLEQTFYLPVECMVNPALSPLKTLEKRVGRELARTF